MLFNAQLRLFLTLTGAVSWLLLLSNCAQSADQKQTQQPNPAAWRADLRFLVEQLEAQTHTRFVGEPTGGSPNQYGDANPFSLPNSGLVVRISTLYHQRSQPDDQRVWHKPDIPVPLSSADYFNHHDPAMETILMDTPTSSVDNFHFQPQKVSVGTVYHYLKTNIDGSMPEHISLYVAAQDRLEAFKFHPGAERAALVVAEMDWAIYSAKMLDSWQVFAGGRKNRFATMNYLHADRAIQTDAPGFGRSAADTELVPIRYLPFHMYNFDLSSLNFAFRHFVIRKPPLALA